MFGNLINCYSTPTNTSKMADFNSISLSQSCCFGAYVRQVERKYSSEVKTMLPWQSLSKGALTSFKMSPFINILVTILNKSAIINICKGLVESWKCMKWMHVLWKGFPVVINPLRIITDSAGLLFSIFSGLFQATGLAIISWTETWLQMISFY